MRYHSLIQTLFDVNRNRKTKLDLSNCLQLQKLLGYPDTKFSTIHVAGTNGKGSVSLKIAETLQEAGYKVGLFTSPHISSFRERIKVNREMISELEVEKLLPSLLSIIEKHQIPATFFEITTFLAFLFFVTKNIDVAVLEVGLGGRLDATNIIHPLLSIITSISFDHSEILGNTLEAIAIEKGGIIKKKTPVLIGPQVPYTIIQKIAHQKESPLTQIKGVFDLYEEENCAIAREALNILSTQFDISIEAITKGIGAKQPCRFELVNKEPLVFLDVAHNPDGMLHLFRTARKLYPYTPFRVVLGMSKNKDILTCLKIIAQEAHYFYLVKGMNPRGCSLAILEETLLQLSVSPKHILHEKDLQSTLQKAIEDTKKHQEILIVCGSFFIMGEVREALSLGDTRDSVNLNEV